MATAGHQEQDKWQRQDTKSRADGNGRTPRAGQMATAGHQEQGRWQQQDTKSRTNGNGRTPRAGQMATAGHQDRNKWQRQDTKDRTDGNGKSRPDDSEEMTNSRAEKEEQDMWWRNKERSTDVNGTTRSAK